MIKLGAKEVAEVKKVVTLDDARPPEPKIWQCECGCVSFYLYDNGALQCNTCFEWQFTNQGTYIDRYHLQGLVDEKKE